MVPQETGGVPPRGSHSLSVDQSGRCMLNTIDGPSESVEDYLCDPEEMPLGARESRLPCPEDCVLNDWGAWSRCSLVSRSSSWRWRWRCYRNTLRFISVSSPPPVATVFLRGAKN